MIKPRLAVIGAGLMGHGIAQVFALAGYDVAITDSHAPTLASAKDRILANLTDLGDDVAALKRIRICTGLAEAVAEADFIVEAVREDLGVKQKLFADIERAAREDAVLASNTSVIPITAIMGKLENRARALGTHWWNPPYLVPLVEVIATEWTTPAAIALTMTLHADVGKTPVHVKKDVPGFVGNRLQHALWREAISPGQPRVCDAETVDAAIKTRFGPRLAVLVAVENAHPGGTDFALAIYQNARPHIEQRPPPAPYLEKLVAQGRLGMKKGQGFRTWTSEQQAELRARVLRHLKAARGNE